MISSRPHNPYHSHLFECSILFEWHFQILRKTNNEEYLDKFCSDEAEAYYIEKDLKYDRDCWLFNRKKYELEDDYDEDSMP